MRIFTTNSEVLALTKRAFPDYTGKKISIEVCSTPIDVRSYWDGGSRTYFKFMKLDGSAYSVTVPPQSAFDAKVQGAEAVNLVPGLACVSHIYFCGEDLGINIYIHPENAPKLLPPKVDLTSDEKIVLKYTRSLKAHYRFEYASRDTGITFECWEATKKLLASRKLMTTAGALTLEGRNAAAPL